MHCIPGLWCYKGSHDTDIQDFFPAYLGDDLVHTDIKDFFPIYLEDDLLRTDIKDFFSYISGG